MAIATVAGPAGAWREMQLGARALVDTNARGAAGWPMLSGRVDGANAAVHAAMVMVALATTVV
ncbi:hypothetical protein [Hydrogenophaga sp. IBVHS2]|uniref:hypothetical protein n=1 Tax=Hydrogenophaga sp. IBVHS2 TaxID=1985170 RepID=UPI0015C4F52E|nr:hypothetical protein [Hydrogenophaga sp. IBVHS2]